MPARGRPTKYKKHYCDMVIDHMKQGASFTSFAASINVARSRIIDWKKKHEEFRVACEIAEQKSQAWWERLAEQSATGRIFDKEYKGKYERINYGMLQFIMKQRFYRDYNRAPYTDQEKQNNQIDFNIKYDPKQLDE